MFYQLIFAVMLEARYQMSPFANTLMYGREDFYRDCADGYGWSAA